MISRLGFAVDALCALLVIPVWTYFGAVAAVATAIALGLLLRLVARVAAASPPG